MQRKMWFVCFHVYLCISVNLVHFVDLNYELNTIAWYHDPTWYCDTLAGIVLLYSIES